MEYSKKQAERVEGERRTHFRGRMRPGRRIDIRYRRADGADTAAGPAVASAVTANIGVGGAFVITESPEVVGSQLAVQIDVPGHDGTLSIACEVRWICGSGADDRVPGMGIKFAPLDVETLLIMSDFFSSLTSREAR